VPTIPFEITRWYEEPYESADGNTLLRATVEKTFATDDLTGTSTAQLLMVRTADEPQGAAYTAIERVVGVLGGREGGFVLTHGAVTGEPGASGHVVPGSGTGDLAGLTGAVSYEHDEAGPRLLLDYELPS
jgi:hypothetical protein